VSVTGGVLVSLGFFMSATAHSLGPLYFWFGVVAGAGNGFGYATPIPVMSKWFPDKRGLAVGLAVAGYGGGSAIFAPLAANNLIPEHGLAFTFRLLGGVFLVMTMIGALLLKNPPAGYKPPGWEPPPATAVAAATTHDFTPAEMVRTPTFYLMWVAYCLGTLAGLMMISQLAPFMKSVGRTVTVGSATFVLVAIGNASGRIFSGALSDLLGRLNVLRLMIAVSALALPAVWGLGDTSAVFVALFIVYYCYGTQLSVNASTTADFYGTRYQGLNYGLLFTSWGVAGILGPEIGARLYDSNGNYKAAFSVAGALAVVALICELMAHRPSVPRAAGAPATKPAPAT
jgi:OFA family oxalate/formate antiporter-like MFS transporter